MKIYQFALVIFVLSCTTPLAAQSTAIVGSWSALGQPNAQDVPIQHFTLEIQQAKQTISGEYCYITQYGNRIDCNNPFKGKRISDNRYQVDFDSSFGGRNGIAEISLSAAHTLVWTLIQAPQQGAYFIPKYSELSFNQPQPAYFKINKSKVFISHAPNRSSQTKSYLILGDQVRVTNTEERTWVEVEYQSRVLGWIEMQDLDQAD